MNFKTTFSLTTLLKLLRPLWENRWCEESPGGTPIKKKDLAGVKPWLKVSFKGKHAKICKNMTLLAPEKLVLLFRALSFCRLAVIGLFVLLNE